MSSFSTPSFGALFATPPAARYQGVSASALHLTMPDGTRIALDVMLPASRGAQERLPALLIMARYWRSMQLRLPDPPNRAWQGPREPVADFMLARGFAMVIVDSRGSGASFGVSRHPWSPEELSDYAEVAQWVSQQDWCNGKLGAFGISYEGATALRLAGLGVPGVRAVVPQEIEFDVYSDVALPGGIFNQAFIKAWHASNSLLDQGKPSPLFPWLARWVVKGVRPVDADRPQGTLLAEALAQHRANTDVYAAISGITYRDDPFGNTGATLNDFSVQAHLPALEASQTSLFSWGSWLDGATAEATLGTFNSLTNPQIAIIGAWKHEMTAHASPFVKAHAKPEPSQQAQWSALAQFFQQHLVDETPLQGKRLFYTTLGDETRWTLTETFPPPNSHLQAWYFQAGQALAPHVPSSEMGTTDAYSVDFSASTGKRNRWHTQMAQPVVYANRASADKRLLCYTSAPLSQDLEITGYPVLTLYVAASHPDPAFFVYLESVDERGVVRYLTEGQLRGIHRQLSDEAVPYWTGLPKRSYQRADAAPVPVAEMLAYTIGLQPISALVRRGHCIRVALAGADAETFARIPQQGTVNWQVGRGGVHASHIQLPIVR